MNLFKDKQIAVVGVSTDSNKYGYKVFKDLFESGYAVSGVNINGGMSLGQTLYKTLSELKTVPDVVITVVPPAATEQIVEECNKLGIKEIWMQPGSESQTAIDKAKSYGMKVTARACFMHNQKIWKD